MVGFFNKKTYIAKKDYICDLCGKPVKKGEKYIYTCWPDGGHIGTAHNHLDCFDFIGKYCADNWEEEYDNEHVESWVQTLVCRDCDMWSDCIETPFQCWKVKCAILGPGGV